MSYETLLPFAGNHIQLHDEMQLLLTEHDTQPLPARQYGVLRVLAHQAGNFVSRDVLAYETLGHRPDVHERYYQKTRNQQTIIQLRKRFEAIATGMGHPKDGILLNDYQQGYMLSETWGLEQDVRLADDEPKIFGNGMFSFDEKSRLITADGAHKRVSIAQAMILTTLIDRDGSPISAADLTTIIDAASPPKRDRSRSHHFMGRRISYLRAVLDEMIPGAGDINVGAIHTIQGKGWAVNNEFDCYLSTEQQ